MVRVLYLRFYFKEVRHIYKHQRIYPHQSSPDLIAMVFSLHHLIISTLRMFFVIDNKHSRHYMN